MIRSVLTLIIFPVCFAVTGLIAQTAQIQVQDDPILTPILNPLPVIDGNGNDACWENIPWQRIDQVWIPYGETIPDDDYKGHYKIGWSKDPNCLYFLIEVYDDVFVDGFKSGGQTADIYNFDIVEVFIDEDDSGGKHVFDGTGSTGQEWGYNAENAFSYHIYADFPENGGISTEIHVGDLDGTGWDNSQSPNYADHFPEFALTRNQNRAIWEFSLIVYDDTYESDNVESARVQLKPGKEIGLSMAYCENDDPDEVPKVRDNFFGSVWVPAAAYNDHWINADYFGTIKLVDVLENAVNNKMNMDYNKLDLYPNPASSTLKLSLNNLQTGTVTIRMFNILGQEILNQIASKADDLFHCTLPLGNLPHGMYFLETQIGQEFYHNKVMISK